MITFGDMNKGLRLVSTQILTANATYFEFTGLKGDYTYLLIHEAKYNIAGAKDIDIRINGDDTQTNYNTQIFKVDDAVVSSFRSNQNTVLKGDVGGYSFDRLWINKGQDGKTRISSEMNNNIAGSGVVMQQRFCLHDTVITEITSIKLIINVANGYATGSRFRLYKFVS